MSRSYVNHFAKDQKIWFYAGVVDFRKQVNGLVHIIENEMEQSSFEGVYVFRNRQKDKLKVIVWDRNGYFMGYKRLSRGRFDFPVNDEEKIIITSDELHCLLSGMPMVRVSRNDQKMHTH